MKTMGLIRVQILLLALICPGVSLAQPVSDWDVANIRGIHYAVARRSLLPDRWRDELLHTDDCKLPCEVAFDDRISAVHLRYGWMQLNPAPGVYDFSNLGEVLDIIHAAGKKATLVVMAGKFTPPWVFEEGAAHLKIQFWHTDAYTQPEVPVPWDPIFVAAHGELFTALADFLRQTPTRYETLALVKNGALTSHSGETRLMPHMAFMKMSNKHDKASEEAIRTQLCTEFAEAGYEEKKILDTARVTNEQIAEAFPDQYLGLAFVAGSKRFPTVKRGRCTYPKRNYTLNAIIKSMVATYDSRAIVNSTILTEDGGIPKILAWVRENGGGVAFQVEAKAVGCRKDRAVCDESELKETLWNGIKSGATFIEVHDGNINNNQALLRQVNKAMQDD